MLLMLLFLVSHCTIDRKTFSYTSCQGIHICMATLMFTDAILSVFFFDMTSEVLRDSLRHVSVWLACRGIMVTS